MADPTTSWRAIDADDVDSSMTSVEATAVRLGLLNSGQADPRAKVIAQVTTQIRNAIRSYQDNRLHPDRTFLPEGAILHAVALVRNRLLTRYGGVTDIGDDRRTEYKEALAWLKEVRRGIEKIENPFQEESAAAPQPSPRINARNRRFSRDQQDGI